MKHPVTLLRRIGGLGEIDGLVELDRDSDVDCGPVVLVVLVVLVVQAQHAPLRGDARQDRDDAAEPQREANAGQRDVQPTDIDVCVHRVARAR